MEYPIIRKIMKMTAGSISIPAEVKRIFASIEDEATAEIWFKLLDNEFLCQHFLCPELTPKSLEKSLLTFYRDSEIQKQVENTGYAYLEYAAKHHSQNQILKDFFLLEHGFAMGEYPSLKICQKIYMHVIYWLEKNLDYDVMLDHADEISDLMKVIVLTRSNIMKEESFQELFYEKRLDLIALIQ